MIAMPTTSLPSRLIRLLGASPDAITAAACFVVWISPLAFGTGAVKTVVLMMLMEFLLVHGAGFFTSVAFMDEMSKSRRLLAMGALLLFYALFVGVFAWTFHAWWPVWVFLWLAIAKATWVFTARRDRAGEMDRQMAAWAFSVAAYLGAVFAGLMLPVPHLGIRPELVPSLGLPGSGEWVERPHVAVASMVFYYLALAGFKYWRGGARSPRDVS
jgi:hypothetical protein